MMLYLIQLVLIASVMIEIDCQTSSTKDIIANIFAPIGVDTSDPLASSMNKPIIEEPKTYCDSPEPIPNGWIDTTENLPLKMSPVGRSIIYRCNKNMKLIGASSATCEKYGRWSNSPPDCLAPCIIPVVEYGAVRNQSAGATVSHGGKLTFKCIVSYHPAHGLATSICNNGAWNVIPRCEPDPKGNCDTPEIPKGMFVQLDGKNVTNNQTYVVGTEIIYKCSNPNNHMVDDNDSDAEFSRHICDAETHKWKGIRANCVPTCASLIHLVRLKLIDTDRPELRNVTYDGVVLVGERYRVGTKALFYCNPTENAPHPTAIANNSTVVCRSNGTWDGGLPICESSVARLGLSTIIILISCWTAIFLFALGFLCKKYGYFNRTCPNVNNQNSNNENSNNENSNNENSNNAQGMQAELLRQIRRQSFYSLDETPASDDHGYATIHRPATLRRPPALAVQYGRERPTSEYSKLG